MNNIKLKSIVLSMVLVAGMLLPTSGFAQGVEAKTGGGLFGYGKGFESDGRLFGNSGAGNATITGSGIQNGNFEEVTPLGGGIAILLGAGLGYVAFKKKEDKQ